MFQHLNKFREFMKSILPTIQRQRSMSLPEPLTGLSDIARTIDQGTKETETPFLTFGQDLQTAYSESGDLIRVITEAADRFSETSDKSLTRESDTVVRQVLEELAAYPVRIDRDMEIINNGIGHLEGLCNACQGLNNVSRYLNIIGINFAIEACRSNEATAMFEGFADEIKDLARTSTDIIEKIDKDSRDAILKQKKKMAEVSEKVAQIQALTDQAQDSVLRTMDNIKAISAHSLQTFETAQETAKAVQNGTGEIVMAIQFHDIARQRLEHVISAFEDVMAIAGTAADYGSSSKGKKLPHQVLSTLKIQSEQMGQVAQDIEQASVNIDTALEEIRKKVAALGEGMAASDDDTQTGGLAREFKAMGDQLDHLKQIQHQAGRISQEMGKAIKESSEIVMVLSQYTDQIRSLNINIQHKALNAIIMTSRLGDSGRTLEVLAREVRNLSVSCNDTVSDVVTHLDRISGLTRKLSQTEQKTEGVSLSENITAVSAAMEDQNRDTHAINGQITLLEEKFNQARQGLSFISGWSGQLLKDRNLLDNIIQAILPLADTEPPPDNQNHDTVLSSRYTMESERKIHQRIIGQDSDPLAPIAVFPVVPEPPDDEDLQKTEEAEKTRSGNETSSPEPSGKGSEEELPEYGLKDDIEEEPEEKEEDFGDNIELF